MNDFLEKMQEIKIPNPKKGSIYQWRLRVKNGRFDIHPNMFSKMSLTMNGLKTFHHPTEGAIVTVVPESEATVLKTRAGSAKGNHFTNRSLADVFLNKYFPNGTDQKTIDINLENLGRKNNQIYWKLVPATEENQDSANESIASTNPAPLVSYPGETTDEEQDVESPSEETDEANEFPLS